MLKKTITYNDYNGVERTEDFYFNLSRSEITEMELSIEGGLAQKIKSVSAAQDGGEIMRIFKEIILKAYGEKSPDGKHFVKSNELSIAFTQTQAYDQLFMTLVTDPKAAAAFVNAIIPEMTGDKQAIANAKQPNI